MDRSEYNKKYYNDHKNLIISQIKAAQNKSRLRNFIEKLNSGGFKRFPYLRVEKLNIKFDPNTKIYSV
jgi:hypothetical protein